MSRCTLDIDNRESKVLAHTEELSAIQYEKKQLTTADYIVRQDATIIAAIERKSLDDAAASIKDGRMANTAKLLRLRSMTGCRVIFIIECPKDFPNDDKKKFSNIPLGHIRSMIYHLILRDNVSVMWTIGTIGTARELVKLVQCTESLLLKNGDASFLKQNDQEQSEDGGDAESFDLADLTKRYERTNHEIVRDMWNCFRGISVESADDYMAKWSIYDIVTRAVPRSTIETMQMSNRRKISKIAVDALCGFGPILESKLLACVPGISTKSATDILRGRDLRTVITAPLEIIATYKTGTKSVGNVRAQRIITLFLYKNGEPSVRPDDDGHVLVEETPVKRKPTAAKPAASKPTAVKPAASKPVARIRATRATQVTAPAQAAHIEMIENPEMEPRDADGDTTAPVASETDTVQEPEVAQETDDSETAQDNARSRLDALKAARLQQARLLAASSRAQANRRIAQK